MKQSEKEELLKKIEENSFAIGLKSYFANVIDINELYKIIEKIPTDKEDVKEVYAIRNISTGDIIWSARGSAYKEMDDVKKKLNSLDGRNLYKIITYKLEE